MAYNSKISDVYHIYKKCTVGNNIEKDNRPREKLNFDSPKNLFYNLVNENVAFAS